MGAMVIFALVFAACSQPVYTSSDHIHKYGEWSLTTPATCLASGLESRVCTLNPKHVETQIISDPNAHVWGAWAVTLAANCTDDGDGTHICTVCGVEDPNHVIPSLGGHAWGAWTITQAATCENVGSGSHYCTVCNAEDPTHDIPAIGHDWGAWETTTAATCESKGSRKKICNNDSAHTGTEDLPIDLGKHTYTYTPYPNMVDAEWTAATEIDANTQAIYCTDCNKPAITRRTGSTSFAAFTLINNSTEYTVRTTYGGKTSGDLYIPAYYRASATGTFLPVTAIGSATDALSNGAFSSSTAPYPNFTAVYIPPTVKNIYNAAFSGCSNLVTLAIPEGVTYIGAQAFMNCSKLTAVTIPASVTYISSDRTFGICTVLTSITVAGDNQHYISDGAMVYNKEKTALIQAATGVTGNVELPASVTTFPAEYAFQRCVGLTGIKLPASLTRTGVYAFAQCSGLTSIELPAGLIEIDGSAFYSCTNLAGPITIPATVTFIGNSAFSSCRNLALTSAELPAGLTEIGNSAFSGCTSITEIIIPVGVEVVGNSAFSSWTAAQIIYVREFANEQESFDGWGTNWKNSCNAVIKYWNGSEYQ